MNVFKLIRFIREKNTKRNNEILPPKPMPLTQKTDMKIDLVIKKNKK